MNSVSVIIPFYKKHRTLKRAIKSVLDQSNQNFEIIIIHDDPNDQDIDFMNSILNLDSRIKILKNNNNLGAGESRNKGIQNSSGNYIAFLDADDYWKKNKLEIQLTSMKKNNIEFSHTSYIIEDIHGNYISKRIARPLTSYKDLLKTCDIGLSSVLIKKEILRNFCFPDLKTKEDYVLWLLLAKSGIKIQGIDLPLMTWVYSKNSLSSNTLQKLMDGYKVYKTYLKFNFFLSFLFLFRLSINYIKKNIK